MDTFGLAVLTTLGIMAAGGFVSAIISAGSSIVEQKLFDGQIDWTAVMADAAWGFIDGAISSSPLGAWWKVASDATISLGKELTDVYIASENKDNWNWLNEVDPLKVTVNVFSDTIFSISHPINTSTAYHNIDVNTKKEQK